VDVVLTGGTGFIGTPLRRSLAVRHTVHALTRRRLTAAEQGVDWVHADLSRPDDPWRLPLQADAVIHLAQADGYREFPEKAADVFSVNVASVMKLLDHARRSGVKRFIYVSTANVYALAAAPIAESGAVAPSTFYARSKRIGELLVESYGSLMSCTIVRLFTVYGPAQRADMLIPSLIERVRSGRPIDVKGRCGLTLTPVYVDDVVDVLARIAGRDSAPAGVEVFNVGGDEAVDMPALADRIGSALSRRAELNYVAGEDGIGWAANSDAVKQALGWHPRTTLLEGLRRVAQADPVRTA
jgi:nucleoside-diphosphate-sugar epimerase